MNKRKIVCSISTFTWNMYIRVDRLGQIGFGCCSTGEVISRIECKVIKEFKYCAKLTKERRNLSYKIPQKWHFLKIAQVKIRWKFILCTKSLLEYLTYLIQIFETTKLDSNGFKWVLIRTIGYEKMSLFVCNPRLWISTKSKENEFSAVLGMVSDKSTHGLNSTKIWPKRSTLIYCLQFCVLLLSFRFFFSLFLTFVLPSV